MKALKILVFTFASLILVCSSAASPAGQAGWGAFGSKVDALGIERQAQRQQPSGDVSEALAEAGRLSKMVVKLFGEKKYDEALPIAQKVLQIRELHLDPNDERIAAAAINLAEIYDAQRKFGDAERLFERALGIYEKQFGPDHEKVADVLNRLFPVYFNRWKFSECERAAQRSIAIREKVFGAESVALADSLHMLGEFYRFRNPVNAEPFFDRALMIMQKHLPLDNAKTRKLIEHYSCLYYETGQHAKVKSLGEKYVPEGSEVKSESELSGAVLNGRAIKLPKPAYPAEAREARAAGTVIIKVVIDERGKVIEASDMCGGHPILAKASVTAAQKAEFTPTTLSGQPVKVTGIITYNFVPVR